MEGEELRAGKERVRRHLIEPLVGIGMVRKKGVTIDTHKTVLESLAARLAYMDGPRHPLESGGRRLVC